MLPEPSIAPPAHPGRLFEQYLDSQRKVYPAHKNRVSQAGHPCERALVYMRTAWKEALPPERRVQGILLFGTDYERALKRRLLAAGYLLREPSRPAEWPAFELTGTDDGDISWDNGETWHLAECKGLHTYYFGRVSQWRDFLEMGPIYSKYPAQLQLYMLLNNLDRSFFVLGRKGTYEVAFIPCELDYVYAEGILRKLERVNAHVKAGTLPDKLNDVDACEICDFRLHCGPELPYVAGWWSTHEPEAVALLIQHEQLSKTKSAADADYRDVHDKVKRMTAGSAVCKIGDYVVTNKADRRGVMRMQIRNLGVPEELQETEEAAGGAASQS